MDTIWYYIQLLFSGDDNEDFYEEIPNTITHFIAILFSIVGSYFMIIVLVNHAKRSWQHIVGCVVFCMSCLVLYSVSTFYHLNGVLYHGDQDIKEYYRTFDHMAIFLQISGTYTPLILLLVKYGYIPKAGYGVLAWVWIFTVLGVVFKLAFPIDFFPEWVHNSLYVLQSFSCVFIIKNIIYDTPKAVLYFLTLGGAYYLIGLFWMTLDILLFNHSIWHVFCIFGTFYHFISILITFQPPEDMPFFENLTTMEILKCTIQPERLSKKTN
eukprot:TRINITY_DN11271_c0_g1_i1.p1 TRINITY_DN11271_c0_g1~~TRINITY_DN11271_c0_g1_i1.p1  ORF type:complete len:268 (+),score=22.87 TRINITY_DN11271_c0_g1_i1:1-804(+)